MNMCFPPLFRYDLIVLDRAGLGYDNEIIVGEDGGKVGGSACFASSWVDHLVPLVLGKVDKGGLRLVETDGPYGGAHCSATNHSHHTSLEDSMYWQTRLMTEFYQLMRERGVSVNAPDRYFNAGANKMMFYGDPTNFGRPRKMDLLLSRQMIFDNTCVEQQSTETATQQQPTMMFCPCSLCVCVGTNLAPYIPICMCLPIVYDIRLLLTRYEWLPTQGWSLLPIHNYGGGTAEAAFSPLEENIADYDLAWAQYMGYGVSGVCWRGERVFEGPKSKASVAKWVRWYKR